MSEQEELRDDAPAPPGDDRRQMEPQQEAEEDAGIEFENEPSPHQGEEGQEPAWAGGRWAMTEREPELPADMRPGDAPEEPLEQDRDSEVEQIEEAVHEARPADPRIAEPPP
jgi:hypothetical protein